jgi:hypothetical protein
MTRIVDYKRKTQQTQKRIITIKINMNDSATAKCHCKLYTKLKNYLLAPQQCVNYGLKSNKTKNAFLFNKQLLLLLHSNVCLE